MAQVLVVDDEQMIRFAFEQFLEDEGHTALLAEDAETALEQLSAHRPEVAFLDYRLPGRDGLELLEEIRRIGPQTTVVFMTAFGALEVAIKAMQLGAYEYVTKPLDLDKIRILISRIMEGKRSLRNLSEPEGKSQGEVSREKMVGRGPAMQEVFKIIGLLTTREVTVLITGESGSGKELVARAIHENSSRGQKPFVALNCGAMPEHLLEAEMFGFEKGAFTGAESRKPGKFEVAEGGSIFLDEIGELHPTLQVKLLRVLQERSFERIGGNTTIKTDVRVLAATNKDLGREVAAGRFRRDLFYRLHLIHLHLPPLRERKEDIPPLVEHFILKANRELNRDVRGLTQEAVERLLSYSWPGNIRELENEIKRAMVISRENVLPAYLFQLEGEPVTDSGHSSADRLAGAALEHMDCLLHSPDPSEGVFDRVLATVEKAMIGEALRRTSGNQVHASELLGLHRATLRKKKGDYRL